MCVRRYSPLLFSSLRPGKPRGTRGWTREAFSSLRTGKGPGQSGLSRPNGRFRPNARRHAAACPLGYGHMPARARHNVRRPPPPSLERQRLTRLPQESFRNKQEKSRPFPGPPERPAAAACIRAGGLWRSGLGKGGIACTRAGRECPAGLLAAFAGPGKRRPPSPGRPQRAGGQTVKGRPDRKDRKGTQGAGWQAE